MSHPCSGAIAPVSGFTSGQRGHDGLHIPELEMLIQEGRFGFEDVHAEWPHIVAGQRPGRQSSGEVIVYIGLGIWGEYAVILPQVYRRALALGLGKRLRANRET